MIQSPTERNKEDEEKDRQKQREGEGGKDGRRDDGVRRRERLKD